MFGEQIAYMVDIGVINGIVLVFYLRMVGGKSPKTWVLIWGVTVVVTSRVTWRRIMTTLMTMMSLWQILCSFWLRHDIEENAHK